MNVCVHGVELQDFSQLKEEPQTQKGVTTWTYIPPKTEYQSGKQRLELLSKVLELLPENKLILADYHKEVIEDYPSLPYNSCKQVGYTYLPRCKRPIFCVGGYAFFRRYNDEYDGTVMYSHWQDFNGQVSWSAAVGPDFLPQLHNLLTTKPASSITADDISQLLN